MNRTIDWEDQRAFLAVLDEGSLSAAARRLGVSQPTMRAKIASLEQALGTVLFTRSVRGLVPTAQARALGTPARAMARASEIFVRSSSASSIGAGGIVRISVSEVVGVEILPPMLASLRRDHPDLIVEIVLSNMTANLLEQEVDLAVRMTPPGQDALTFRKVTPIPIGLFAHESYLKRRGSPANLDDLQKHDLIGPDRMASDLALVEHLFPNLEHNRFVVRTDSHPAQLAAARAGLGIALIQSPIGRADPGLQPVLPGLIGGKLETWIVTHEDLRDVPRIRVLFDHLVEQFDLYAKHA